jgi:hypothetical protein
MWVKYRPNASQSPEVKTITEISVYLTPTYTQLKFQRIMVVVKNTKNRYTSFTINLTTLVVGG